MRAASFRPAGCVIGAASPVKLKCLELLPRSPAQGYWARAWVNYSESDFDARMANAVAWGANSVKISLQGPNVSGAPGPVAFERNVQSFCGLLRKYGLKLYLNIGGASDFFDASGALFASITPGVQSGLAMWMTHGGDLLVGGDCCNEVQFGGPATWNNPASSNTYTTRMANDLAAMLATVRAVTPGIPWTFSVYNYNAGNLTSDLMRLQAMLRCDFHDYHPYNGEPAAGIVPGASYQPKSSDLVALESASWFIGRYLFGEWGIETVNSDAAAYAFIAGVASQAQRPLSAGGVLFGDIDYQDSNSGVNQPFGITGRPGFIQAFQTWPGSPL